MLEFSKCWSSLTKERGFTTKFRADLHAVALMLLAPRLYNICCIPMVQLDHCQDACYTDSQDYVTLSTHATGEVLPNLPEEEVV